MTNVRIWPDSLGPFDSAVAQPGTTWVPASSTTDPSAPLVKPGWSLTGVIVIVND